MSVIIIPFSSLPDQASSFSMPNAVSLGFSDDGGGGNLLINGLGVLNAVVSGAIDLKTLFVTTNSRPFNSYPLLNAFRALNPGNQTDKGAQIQLVTGLHVTIVPLTTGLAAMPALEYLASISPVPQVPFLVLVGPAVAGNWRIDIKLRHSITN